MNNHDHHPGQTNGSPQSGGEPNVREPDVQALLARYGTGTLSAAELAQLHRAALDDQDLFDALAEEQAVKELVELPGARERLVAALAPQEARGGAGVRAAEPGGWRAWLWPWAPVAGLVASMGLLTLWMLQTPASEDSVAKVKDFEPTGLPYVPDFSAASAQKDGGAGLNQTSPSPTAAAPVAGAQPADTQQSTQAREFRARADAPQQGQGGQPPQGQQGQAAIGANDPPAPVDPRRTAQTQFLPEQTPAVTTVVINGAPANAVAPRLEAQGQANGRGGNAGATQEVTVPLADRAGDSTVASLEQTEQAAAALASPAVAATPKDLAKSEADALTRSANASQQAAVTAPPPPAAAGKGTGGFAPAGIVGTPQAGAASGRVAAVGGAGKAGGAGAAKGTAAVTAAGFSHEFLANGRLRIIPHANGTLEVRAGADPQDALMFPRNPVVAGTPIELPVPDGVARVRIEFQVADQPPVVETPLVPARGK